MQTKSVGEKTAGGFVKLSKRSAFILVVIASLSGAFVTLGDAYITNSIFNPVSEEHAIAGAMAYLTVGGLIGGGVTLLLTILTARFFGGSDYTGIKMPSPRVRRLAILSGVFAALAQGVLIYAYQNNDPTLVAILSFAGVFYLAINDVYRMKELKWGDIIIPLFIILLGATFSTLRSPDINIGSIVASLGSSFLLVFIIRNVFFAIGKALDKNAVDHKRFDDSIDAWNYNMWRFGSLALFAVIVSVIFTIAMGQFGEYVELVGERFTSAAIIVAMVMIGTFFANGYATKAIQHLSVTEANLGESLKLPFVFIIVVIADQTILSGQLGDISYHPLIVLSRLLGGAIIIYGVLMLANRKDEAKEEKE